MVNVGIVGIGFMGMIHYLAYQNVSGAKVAAICTRNKKRLDGDWRGIKGNFGPEGTEMDLSGVARYPTLDELLADPQIDLVDLCLPPHLHADAAIQCLQAGKHVLVEKPICLFAKDAERMLAAADEAKRLLMVAHVLPFFPEYAFAYKVIKSGKYGKLIGGMFKRVISDPTWIDDFYNPNTVGGPVVDLHIHDAHFIRVVCGMPESVSCNGRMRDEVVEYMNSQFKFADPKLTVASQMGIIQQQGRPFTHAYEIHLEQATLVYDLAGIEGGGVPLTVLTADGKVETPELTVPVAFEGELAAAVGSVTSGKPDELLSGKLAADALTLCERETQSVVEGKPVAV